MFRKMLSLIGSYMCKLPWKMSVLFIYFTGLLPGSIDISKSSLTQSPLNFSTLTPSSTTPLQMSSTQIVKVATPGVSQPSIVQISAPTPISSSSHVTDGSILKHQAPFPSHLPRGLY